MHPILSDVRKLFSYMLAWLLAGIFIAKLLVAADLAGWNNALLFALPVALVYGFLASSAYYVCRSQPFARRHFWFAMPLFGGASLMAGGVWLLTCQGWNKLARDAALIDISSTLAVLLFAGGSIFYLLSILAHDVLIAFDNLRQAERREAQSRLLARDAELQALRAQINPHFLFNSLNSISALTSVDAAAARNMAIELAQFFRETLALSDQQKIPLVQEIALCQSYLAIEKIRFGPRLKVDIEIGERAPRALLPPLVLQALVENAVKHGIRDLVDGGTITIKGLTRDNWLHLAIENPVDPHPTSVAGNGLGLKNIRLRLAAMYGGQARVTWANSGTVFLVEIVLPLELE